MLPFKAALDAYPADRVRSPFGRLPYDSYSVPTSPKIHELRSRHKTLHATEGKSTHSDLKIGHP